MNVIKEEPLFSLKVVSLLFSGTKNIILRTLKIGQSNPETANLELENHGFLNNHALLLTE